MGKRKLVSQSSGREIFVEGKGLEGLAIGLHNRLIAYGDIKGVDGVASITIKSANGQLDIEVDRDCEFSGIYNGNSGVMTKDACRLGLKACLFSDLSWVLLPQEEFENHTYIDGSPVSLDTLYPSLPKDKGNAMYCAQEYYRAKDLIGKLPTAEAIPVYNFLD